MRTKDRLVACFLAISLLACSLGAHAVLITTNSSFVNVEVNGADFNLDFIERPPALPLALTDSVVSPDGTATSAATYDFFNNPNNAAFNIDYVFGLEDSFSASASGTIIFDVAETLSYVLSGSFNATSDDPDDELRQFVRLTDLGGQNPNLFFQFDLPPGGVANEVLAGPGLTGTLLPGQYQFLYQPRIQADVSDGIFANASGTGFLSLEFSRQQSTTAAPEPSTLALLGLGLLGVGYARRLRLQ